MTRLASVLSYCGFAVVLLSMAVIYPTSSTAKPTKAHKQSSLVSNLALQADDIQMTIIESQPIKDMPVTKQVYISNPEGVMAMYLPSENAFEARAYIFGSRMDVINEVMRQDGLWYEVKERYSNLGRDDDRDGEVEVISSDGEEWVKIYVKAKDTSAFNPALLDPQSLGQVAVQNIGENFQIFDSPQPMPSGYFRFEVIDKETFEKKKKIAINFLSKDAQGVSKKNGVLSLPARQKKVKFIDELQDNDGYAEYGYVGQIRFLNQFLIYGSYWEIANYIMVNKETGEETYQFLGYPYISPNKKHIISIGANPYEMTGDLSLYRLQGKNITHIASFGFANWMPTTNDIEDIFWARDGYLYMAVNHINAYWNETGSYNSDYQYIRIKVIK